VLVGAACVVLLGPGSAGRACGLGDGPPEVLMGVAALPPVRLL
jgi:hypothetical protein